MCIYLCGLFVAVFTYNLCDFVDVRFVLTCIIHLKNVIALHLFERFYYISSTFFCCDCEILYCVYCPRLVSNLSGLLYITWFDNIWLTVDSPV